MTHPLDPEPNSGGTDAADGMGAHPPSADVVETVKSIIGSGVLGKSERRADLLHHLVNMELAGRGAELKAFSIAVDVLGRDASFDPNTDSIVRSEIGRLRDALRLYFAEKADPDDVRIEIPKGTYRPRFSAEAADPMQTDARFPMRVAAVGMVAVVVVFALVTHYTDPWGEKAAAPGRGTSLSELPYEVVRIAVAPFEGSGSNPNADKLAFGTHSELTMDLSAYPWISVVSPLGEVSDLDTERVDYVLSGELYWEDDTILASAKLVEVPDETLVWSDTQTLNADAGALRSSVVDVASEIAISLGSRHGVGPELAKARNAHGSPENLEAFLCYLGMHRYLAVPSDPGHHELRECLLEAVSAFPGFGDGWAALSLVYMDEARFHRNPRQDANPWQDAGNAVRQALKHAPIRMPTLNAALIHSIEAPKANRADFEQFATLLIDLYPRHPPTLYNVGSRMAEFTGQWDRGLALVDQAIYLTPNPPSAYFVTNAYRAAKQASDEEALWSVQPLTAVTSASQLLLRYLAAARNGLPGDMSTYREFLRQQGLSGNDDIVRHVQDRRYETDLEAALLDQLTAAFQMEVQQ